MIAGLFSWLATMKMPFSAYANNLTFSEVIGIGPQHPQPSMFARANPLMRDAFGAFFTLNFEL